MSIADLSPEEKNALDRIIEDLRIIFAKEEILPDELDDILRGLRSEEVKSYLRNLALGSKPETALREAFFAGKSPLTKYLFGTAVPEVRENGFVDYLLKDEMGRLIVLELKSLFESEVEYDKAGKPVLKRLKQRKLDWRAHKSQIIKYIQSGEYVILTNLKEWIFFSRSVNVADLKPFYTVEFFQFVKEYEVIGNLKDYADRKEFQSIRYDLLTKEFFENLKKWVEKLSEVEFIVDEKRKLELIINLINKFIFIQTLDDYGVIDFKWIMETWNYCEKRWHSKGKLEVLKRFFEQVNGWFYDYYDTELFKEDILPYIKKNEKNIDILYENLSYVLGLKYWKTPLGGFKGIMQYNFRQIDEDVLGKAYETFLAEQRKEKGAFYTPKYITEYIVENTLGKLCDEILEEVEKAVEAEDLDKLERLVNKFISVKVLDPACGSGSFLIKALRRLYHSYIKLAGFIENLKRKYDRWTSLLRPPEIEAKIERIDKLLENITGKRKMDLISKVLVRHIHGVDLDKRALEVAKVNIWLEAIKLAPEEFRYDKLPQNINHILPSLEINLLNGDSLVGLSESLTIKYLIDNHKEDLVQLSDLRQQYLSCPMNPALIRAIESIKQKIRHELNKEFKAYLKRNHIPTLILNLTKPFHWALEFWFNYFGAGDILPLYDRGFDVIVGNPPYGRIKQLIKNKTVKEIYGKYYDKTYSYQKGNYNYYKLFIEKCFLLLKRGGYFSMIFPTAFLGEADSQPLRKMLFENAEIIKILQFPEKTKVFEDVTQDVMILVYAKNKREDYSFMIRTNISREYLDKLEQLDFLRLRVRDIKAFSGETYRIPVFNNPEKEWKILTKISRFPPFKGNGSVLPVGEIGVGHLDETFDKEYLSEEDTGDLVVKGIHLDQYFVNLDPDGPQPRWVKKEAFLMKKPKARENVRYERIIGRNTLNRRLKPRLRFTLLPKGYVITNAVKYIIRKDKSLDPAYIIGLLNSSLLNWRFELFSSQNNIRNYEIEELPFVRAEADSQSKIIKNVRKILKLRKAQYFWFKYWDYWQTELKNDERSLYDILSEDARLIRLNRLRDTWTSRASFYSFDLKKHREVLDQPFDRFEVVGDNNQNIVRVYGIREDFTEKIIYEMEYNDRNLMLHVYSALRETLQSRAKIKTLQQLLSKTLIPIVKHVNKSSRELTPNIIVKVKNELNEQLRREQVSCISPDIVNIENNIERLKAEIDALVFKLYGLNKDEINTVLDSLHLPLRYQQIVMKCFEGLI